MRTLKKTLCLVLVLAMMAGLCMISASAVNYENYTDADAVGEDYKEAIDAMIGAGVVAGTTATTLEPTGTYTREQAAKIVAYLSLGKTAADKLTAGSAPFTDVAADRWSAGYISYCVSMGIIKGYGDGNFGPADALSGYAFAKMLLCSMGYGQKGEYEGTTWEINVAKDALATKSAVGGTNSVISKKNIAAATADPIQRQQAIRMAFDAMQIDNVKYSALLSTYVEIGNNVYGGGEVVDPVYLMTNLGIVKYAGKIGYSATDKAYVVNAGTTKVAVDADYTMCGRTAHVWAKKIKGEWTAVSDYYLDDKVVATSTNGTSIADLRDVDGRYYVGTQFIASTFGGTGYTQDGGVTYYVNGVSLGYNGNVAPTVKKGGEVTMITTKPNGDGKIDVVLYTEKTVDTVGNAGVKYSSDKKTATIAGVVDVSTDVKKLAGFEDLKKDDVVLYVKDPADVYHFELAESFTGTLASTSVIRNVKNYLVGGSNYTLTGLLNSTELATLDAAITDASVEGTYWTDNAGYVVAFKATVEPLSDYVILVAADNDSTMFSNDAVYGKLLKMDGTTEAVKLGEIKYAENSAADVIATGATERDYVRTTYLNQFYTYKIVNGKYNLTKVGETANARFEQDAEATTVYATNATQISGAPAGTYLNAKTVFLYNGKGDTYKTATGIAAAPTTTAAGNIIYVYNANTKVITHVFLTDAESNLQAATGANTVFLLSTTPIKEVIDNPATTTVNEGCYVYAAVKDGVYTEKMAHSYVDGNTGNAATDALDIAYYDITVDKDGYIITWSKNTTNIVAAAKGTRQEDDGVISLGGAVYTYTSNCIVRFAEKDAQGVWSVTTGVIADIVDDCNDVVTVTKDTNGVAKEIMIVKNGNATGLVLSQIAGPKIKVEAKRGESLTDTAKVSVVFANAAGTAQTNNDGDEFTTDGNVAVGTYTVTVTFEYDGYTYVLADTITVS